MSGQKAACGVPDSMTGPPSPPHPRALAPKKRDAPCSASSSGDPPLCPQQEASHNVSQYVPRTIPRAEEKSISALDAAQSHAHKHQLVQEKSNLLDALLLQPQVSDGNRHHSDGLNGVSDSPIELLKRCLTWAVPRSRSDAASQHRTPRRIMVHGRSGRGAAPATITAPIFSVSTARYTSLGRSGCPVNLRLWLPASRSAGPTCAYAWRTLAPPLLLPIGPNSWTATRLPAPGPALLLPSRGRLPRRSPPCPPTSTPECAAAHHRRVRKLASCRRLTQRVLSSVSSFYRGLAFDRKLHRYAFLSHAVLMACGFSAQLTPNCHIRAQTVGR